jgi:hypothetical protein
MVKGINQSIGVAQMIGDISGSQWRLGDVPTPPTEQARDSVS